MDTGASTATSAANGPAQASQSGAAGGLFGALKGVKGHGPMAGFEALLAAFFGQQGQDATAGQATGGPALLQGKFASALKSDNKAGQTTMDDALTAGSGDSADETSLDDKLAPDAGPAAAISADAQALAALFAAPLAKLEAQPETTAQAPSAGGDGKTSQAAQPASAEAFALQVKNEALPGPSSDIAASLADGDAATAPAADASGKAKLIELAQALTAGRGGANRAPAAAKPAENAAPAYAPPAGAPPELAAAAAAAKAQTQIQSDAAPATATGATIDPAVLTKVAAVETPAAPPPAPGKDRFGARPSRLEGAKDTLAPSTFTAATSTPPVAAKPAGTFASFSAAVAPADADATPDQVDPDRSPQKVETSDDAAQAAAAPVSAHATPEVAHAATVAVRGAPETVASLAAQIVKKAEGRATRFDVELHPADLGRVDVRLEIGAHGRLTASMSFENPQAAAELRGRADELQRALESAGFDLSGGLSFDVAGDRGQGQNQARQDNQDLGGGVLRGRAFDAALATAGETATAALAGALSAYQGRLTPGLDIRI